MSFNWAVSFRHKVLRTPSYYVVGLFMVFLCGTGYFQYRSMMIAKHRNVLVAMGIISQYRPYLGFTIQNLYKRHVHEVFVDGVSGKIFWNSGPGRYPLYVVGRSIYAVEHYAFSFQFEGAYGPMEGLMAIDGDGATVTGFKLYRDYEQGAGSRLGQSWFSAQFRGKRIADYSGNYVGIRVVTGRLEDKVPISDMEWTVRGAQGALASNVQFEIGLEQTLRHYEPFSATLRKSAEGRRGRHR